MYITSTGYNPSLSAVLGSCCRLQVCAGSETCGAAGQSWQHGEGPEVIWEEELSLSPKTGTEKKKTIPGCYCRVFLPSLSDCGKHTSFMSSVQLPLCMTQSNVTP